MAAFPVTKAISTTIVHIHPVPIASISGCVTTAPVHDSRFRRKFAKATPLEDFFGVNSVGAVLMAPMTSMTPSPKKRQATQPTAQFNKDASKFIGLHAYCWRPCMEGYEGQQILVVSRPGIAYEGGERLGKYDFTIDVMDAEVLAMFIPADGEIFDEIDEEEEEPAGKAVKKQDDGDEDWVEEKEE